MKSTETFYAVQITGAVTKKTILALGQTAGPALFWWRKSAVALKRGLIANGFKSAKVVKVTVSHTWQ